MELRREKGKDNAPGGIRGKGKIHPGELSRGEECPVFGAVLALAW